MNRRGFLKILGGAAAGAIIVPKVTYFLPPSGGWTTRPSGLIQVGEDQFIQLPCPPFCNEHLHRWQVDKVVEDFKRQVMGPWPHKQWPETEFPGKVGAYQADGGDYFMGQASSPDGNYYVIPASPTYLGIKRRRA